jgi:hypothetical protein
LQYVVSELFERRLGYQVQWVFEENNPSENGIATGYGSENGFFPSSGILEESGQRQYRLIPHEDYRQAVLIDGNGNKTKGDLPGMAFWLLSRYEEYDAKTDEHGRFPEEALAIVQAGLEEIPLIEKWLWQWKQNLPENSGKPWRKEDNQPVWTFDLDNPTAFRYKGWMRNLGGMARDLRKGDFSRIRERIEVLGSLRPDPFDNLSGLTHATEHLPHPSPFFIWIGDYGPNDKGLSPQHPFFRERIKELARHHPLGLHPSYASFQNPDQLRLEKERLENLIGKPISINRFHFLRYRLPQSFRQLLEAGFLEDWSMGFSNRYGFRAGTGNSFHWYDLENERASSLLLVPFLAMDSMAYHKRGETAQAFRKKISGLMSVPDTISYSAKVVLHNEFPTWENWEQLLSDLRTFG